MTAEPNTLSERSERTWTQIAAERIYGMALKAADIELPVLTVEALIEEAFEKYASQPQPEAWQPRLAEHYAVFQAGWNAGFQEAQEPDRFPWQNRCEVRYREVFPAPPEPVAAEPPRVNTGSPPDRIWVHPWRETLYYSPTDRSNYIEYVRAATLRPISDEAEPAIHVRAQWFIDHEADHRIDHACAECVEGFSQDSVREGFQCYYHQAVAMLKGESNG